jgi:uncharacterized membrane protein (UPF0127 family)
VHPAIGEVREACTGRLLIARLTRADSGASRTIGYLGRVSVDDDEGLWLDRCSGVHTLGMRISIDVVFVDRTGIVLGVEEAVRPWRFWVGRHGARSVIEMAAGNARRRGITPSTSLEILWPSRL